MPGSRGGWAGLGAATEFTGPQVWLKKLTGVHVAKELGRQHAAQQGAALEQEQPAALAQGEQTRESGRPAEPDGVLVESPQTGWQGVKVGLVAGCRTERSARPAMWPRAEGLRIGIRLRPSASGAAAPPGPPVREPGVAARLRAP